MSSQETTIMSKNVSTHPLFCLSFPEAKRRQDNRHFRAWEWECMLEAASCIAISPNILSLSLSLSCLSLTKWSARNEKKREWRRKSWNSDFVLNILDKNRYWEEATLLCLFFTLSVREELSYSESSWLEYSSASSLSLSLSSFRS